ncbi:saccharopine dehydrogenase NADP-binding domain-containing protein [Francisella tularensis]|uniref:Saccharopine dehydrogenase family protein n=2 Tax=Francisella tularensis TaxID=263 RepID=A0AAW3D7R6_FRATU|nr:saccharopine dehydrogenase NADP-binding domain-containing protein [Francisella tularensis]AJI68610.1 saccharopine dehydrogenase family protein [Francisella tularensis subsp. tularensis SCHU S4]AJI71312.1 saccharopine dehydrogenase family protein [Francisella tularensis subsp. tularensis]AKE20528.1 saccharopine dehydrogenase family protein [Francisella tularensis subsp. tularensis str. SCHU S4 substr. NR-28534]EZK37922.1 hypothetical protein P250_02679 [Francisella tularensis subsp. tularensi
MVESGDYIVHLLDKHIPDDKPVLERNIDNLKYVELDVTKTTELQKYVKQHNPKSIVSCLPFFLNKSIAKLAGELGLNYFDLTEDVEATDYIKSIAENSKNSFFCTTMWSCS